jgi:hypothetical protein
MGRVARYKKVKKSLSKATPSGGERLSISTGTVKNLNSGSDYFDTVGVWGLVDSGRKPKKRSRTSLRLRAQRNKKGSPFVSKTDCFDLACTDDDDFDLNDPVGTLKKHAIVAEATSPAVLKPSVVSSSVLSQSATTDLTNPKDSYVHDSGAMVPSIDVEEEKLHKKFESQVMPKAPVVASEGRMPGESKRAYSKRVKKETRQIIQRANQLDRNPEKRQKKKEFLTLKKKNGRKRKNSERYADDDDDADMDVFDSDTEHSKLLTGEKAVAARDRATRVQFGEQAERPPVFKELPRGAAKIKKQKVLRSELLDIEEEKRALELLRTKMQAQYATIKARRKRNGEFHL